MLISLLGVRTRIPRFLVFGLIFGTITIPVYILFENTRHLVATENLIRREQLDPFQLFEVPQRQINASNQPYFKLRQKILILTYMRSGSTLMSGVLQQGGDLFFSMEPLWGVYRKCYRRRNDVCCRNDTCREPSGQLEALHATLNIVKSIFDCKFSELPVEVLESFSFFSASKYGTSLRKRQCFGGKTEDINWCKEYLTSQCQSSTGVIVKTLRLSAEILTALSKMVNNLKVIHLFRDPRPVLLSRNVAGDFKSDRGTNLTNYARQLCRRIANDVDVFQKYGLASIPLRYECLVKSPYLTTKRLYKMLSLNFSAHTEKWIQMHMKADSKLTQAGGFGMRSKNSSLIATQWRITMNMEAVKAIDRECKDMYRRTGFLPFTNTDSLRNLNISSYTSTEYTDFMCGS